MSEPVLYFGAYEHVGHHLRSPGGRMLHVEMSPALSWHPDGNYCPGRIPGSPQHARRNRPEVEGEARLTHENGLTILGIWDRSVDTRLGSHSTYIATGTHDFETMRRLCEETYPKRWRKLADRVEIKLVETRKQGR